ncbi:hypothetical protein [Desulfogranum mediterraneum]|uniref:hypothetical protein n=1 Tax=Desulfogranum mediterraneum TaxID=160661 RepID=UPI00041EB173|nr:hypothetical protein [Desulfogranum mediterraneum]
MKILYTVLILALTATAALALTAEEKRIKETYGHKYNAGAVIRSTNACVDQYMLLSDNPDVTTLKPWCEQKVIDGWRPLSKAELERRIKARKKETRVIIVK